MVDFLSLGRISVVVAEGVPDLSNCGLPAVSFSVVVFGTETVLELSEIMTPLAPS
jgi:hypothetical protein